MGRIVVQKLNKKYQKDIELAISYYKVVAAVNNIPLTNREVELLAYTALRGVISSATSKEEFTKKFGSTVATINNMISKLSKLKLLTKIDGKITVNKFIHPDFNSKNLVLQLTLTVDGEPV